MMHYCVKGHSVKSTDDLTTWRHKVVVEYPQQVAFGEELEVDGETVFFFTRGVKVWPVGEDQLKLPIKARPR